MIVEKNYGGPIWGQMHAAEVARAGLTNVVFARRQQNRSELGHQPGVVTLATNKPEMMESLYRLLEMRGLRFSKTMDDTEKNDVNDNFTNHKNTSFEGEKQ